MVKRSLSRYVNYIKTHDSVSCSPRSWRTHRGYIDKKKENVIFTLLYLSDRLTDWNQICYTVVRQLGESAYQIGRKSCQPFPRYKLSKFQFFFFVFSSSTSCFRTLAKIAIKCKRIIPIALKFSTQKENPKANPIITFGANPMNNTGVMTDYSCKTRSICCHAYRVNRFME